jgi:NitT/TauT family transport system substrate-binding protein
MQDTLKDPSAGLESIAKAGDSLMDKNSEKLRLQIALEDLYITPEVEKVGLGGVDNVRLAKTVQAVSKGLGVTPPALDQVFTDKFLPPKDQRLLPPAAERKPLS